jgi:hypothetical protein
MAGVQFGKVARDVKNSNEKIWRAVTRPGNEHVVVTLKELSPINIKEHADGSATVVFSPGYLDETSSRKIRDLEILGLARLNSLIEVSDELSLLLDDGGDVEEHFRSRVVSQNIVLERQPSLFSKEDLFHPFDLEVRVDGIGTSGNRKSLTLLCTILSRVAVEEDAEKEDADVPIPDPEVVDQIRKEIRADIEAFLERQEGVSKKAETLLALIDSSKDVSELDRLREDFESI